MPNHTANNFTVTGPVADVKRFLKQAAGSDKELSFDSLLPLPTVLKGSTAPVRIQPQEEINATWDEWYKRKDEGKLEKWELEQGRPMGVGITQATYDTLMKEYGVSNWYDWSVLNWGTKWDCYDVREWNIAVADEEMTATIYYETAWSPATQLWLTVSQQYPTLTFFHEQNAGDDLAADARELMQLPRRVGANNLRRVLAQGERAVNHGAGVGDGAGG